MRTLASETEELIVKRGQSAQRTKSKLARLCKFQFPGDQDGVNILQVYGAIVFDVKVVVPVAIFGNVPREDYGMVARFVPARFEDSISKDHVSSAKVMYENRCACDFLNLRDIERASGRVTDGDELVFLEGLAVNLIKALGGGIAFGLAGLVRQNVRHDAFVSSFCRIIDNCVCVRI